MDELYNMRSQGLLIVWYIIKESVQGVAFIELRKQGQQPLGYLYHTLCSTFSFLPFNFCTFWYIDVFFHLSSNSNCEIQNWASGLERVMVKTLLWKKNILEDQG